MESDTELSDLQEIPGYRTILKAVLRSQMSGLVKQLANHTEEESVLISVNIQDGTFSHIGTSAGKAFLSKYNDIKSQFLGFCLKRHQQHPDTNTDESKVQDSSDPLPSYVYGKKPLKKQRRKTRGAPYSVRRQSSRGRGDFRRKSITEPGPPTIEYMEDSAPPMNDYINETGPPTIERSDDLSSPSGYASNNDTLPQTSLENANTVQSSSKVSDQKEHEPNNDNDDDNDVNDDGDLKNHNDDDRIPTMSSISTVDPVSPDKIITKSEATSTETVDFNEVENNDSSRVIPSITANEYEDLPAMKTVIKSPEVRRRGRPKRGGKIGSLSKRGRKVSKFQSGFRKDYVEPDLTDEKSAISKYYADNEMSSISSGTAKQSTENDSDADNLEENKSLKNMERTGDDDIDGGFTNTNVDPEVQKLKSDLDKETCTTNMIEEASQTVSLAVGAQTDFETTVTCNKSAATEMDNLFENMKKESTDSRPASQSSSRSDSRSGRPDSPPNSRSERVNSPCDSKLERPDNRPNSRSGRPNSPTDNRLQKPDSSPVNRSETPDSRPDNRSVRSDSGFDSRSGLSHSNEGNATEVNVLTEKTVKTSVATVTDNNSNVKDAVKSNENSNSSLTKGVPEPTSVNESRQQNSATKGPSSKVPEMIVIDNDGKNSPVKKTVNQTRKTPNKVVGRQMSDERRSPAQSSRPSNQTTPGKRNFIDNLISKGIPIIIPDEDDEVMPSPRSTVFKNKSKQHPDMKTPTRSPKAMQNFPTYMDSTSQGQGHPGYPQMTGPNSPHLHTQYSTSDIRRSPNRGNSSGNPQHMLGRYPGQIPSQQYDNMNASQSYQSPISSSKYPDMNPSQPYQIPNPSSKYQDINQAQAYHGQSPSSKYPDMSPAQTFHGQGPSAKYPDMSPTQAYHGQGPSLKYPDMGSPQQYSVYGMDKTKQYFSPSHPQSRQRLFSPSKYGKESSPVEKSGKYSNPLSDSQMGPYSGSPIGQSFSPPVTPSKGRNINPDYTTPTKSPLLRPVVSQQSHGSSTSLPTKSPRGQTNSRKSVPRIPSGTTIVIDEEPVEKPDVYKESRDAYKGFQNIHQGSQNVHQASQDVYKGSQNVHKGSQDVYKGSQDVYKGSRDVHQGSQDVFKGAGGITNNMGDSSSSEGNPQSMQTMNPVTAQTDNPSLPVITNVTSIPMMADNTNQPTSEALSQALNQQVVFVPVQVISQMPSMEIQNINEKTPIKRERMDDSDTSPSAMAEPAVKRSHLMEQESLQAFQSSSMDQNTQSHLSEKSSMVCDSDVPMDKITPKIEIDVDDFAGQMVPICSPRRTSQYSTDNESHNSKTASEFETSSDRQPLPETKRKSKKGSGSSKKGSEAKEEQGEVTSSPLSKQKDFGCGDCGKSFKSKAALNTHFKKHTQDRPFECDVCGKHFSQKGYLKKHIYTHFKEKE